VLLMKKLLIGLVTLMILGAVYTTAELLAPIDTKIDPVIINSSIKLTDYTKLLTDAKTKPDKTTIDKLSEGYIKDFNEYQKVDVKVNANGTKIPKTDITAAKVVVTKQLKVGTITYTYVNIDGKDYTVISAK
jgi:hypothetical protein